MWNWLLVKLGFPDWSNPDAPRFSSDDLYHAALDVLYPIVGSRCCSPETVEDAAETQLEIDHLRAWIVGLQDKRVRYHYGYWLDHFQHELSSAVQNLLTHRKEREMQRYAEREHEDNIRRAPAKEWIPKPPRPVIGPAKVVQ